MRVQSLLDSYSQAVKTRDIEGFLGIYDKAVTAFDAWDEWQYTGLHNWRAVPTDWFTEPGDDVFDAKFRDVYVEGDGDLLVVRGLIDYTSEQMGPSVMTNRFSWIVKVIDGEYKIIHEHTSLPVDRQTGHMMRSPQ